MIITKETYMHKLYELTPEDNSIFYEALSASLNNVIEIMDSDSLSQKEVNELTVLINLFLANK